MEYNEKQRQIMDVALRLFAENGYDKTSIRDIAHRAEVNVAMVSYYFGSKEKLLEAVFINHFTFMKNTLKNIIYESGVTAIEKVEKMVDVFIDTLVSRQLFNQLMMRESSVVKEGPLFEMILEMKKTNRRLIEKAVKSGQRIGVFLQDVDVPFISSVLIGSVNQCLANCRFEAQSANMKDRDRELFKHKRIEILRIHLKRMFIAYLTFNNQEVKE